jgi:hypothetical protein
MMQQNRLTISSWDVKKTGQKNGIEVIYEDISELQNWKKSLSHTIRSSVNSTQNKTNWHVVLYLKAQIKDKIASVKDS